MKKKNQFMLCAIGLLVFFMMLSANNNTFSIIENPKTASPGNVWFSASNDQELGDFFTTNLYVDTGSALLAAYGIDITYDPTIIQLNTSIGNSGVQKGNEGFISAVNPNTLGLLKITGFDINGRGPNSQLHLLTINWIAIGLGTSPLDISVDVLVDPNTNTIGSPQGFTRSIVVKLPTSPPTFSDIPDDLTIEEYTTGNELNWIAIDENPTTYQILRDSIVIDSGVWISGVPITLNVDGLSPGSYDYSIILFDEDYLTVSDSVLVDVEYISYILINETFRNPEAHNWEWAENQIWCSGSGTLNDPYIIQEIMVEGNGYSTGIHIINSRKYLEIIKCNISNCEVGIKLENSSNIKITDSKLFNLKNRGISISNCTNVGCILNEISNIYGQDGQNDLEGSDVQGISLINSQYLDITNNKISKLLGGRGGHGSNGAYGDLGSNGEDGHDGGEGGSAYGLYIDTCIDIVNSLNDIYDIKGGEGGDGGDGGHGGEGNELGGVAGDGGRGGDGGQGGSAFGLYCINSAFINNRINKAYKIFGQDGGFAGYGGDGGDGQELIFNIILYYGGEGGTGGDGGDGGSGTGTYLLNSTNIINKLNYITEIFNGEGGYYGLNGMSGDYPLIGYNGPHGVMGIDGVVNGFLLENANQTLNYLNNIYTQTSTDNGYNNHWDNGTIGNYWQFYEGVDIDDNGIGDSPQSIPGSAGSIDNFPVWDDGMDVFLPLFIDATATGLGAHNWTWALTQDWCIGSGTETDPYIIENVVAEGTGQQIGFLIKNSKSCFEIRNCIFSNFETGIMVVNSTNVKIVGSRIENMISLLPVEGKSIKGIVIESCSNVIIESNIISGINGGDGIWELYRMDGMDGNDAYGMVFNNSMGIYIYNNNISEIRGGNGYNGLGGGSLYSIFGEFSAEPIDGGKGGNGGSSIGLYFEHCDNIYNVLNTLHNFYGGNGGDGGWGSKGSSWPLSGSDGADAGNGGNGGNGGSIIGIYIFESTKIINRLISSYNHFCGNGGDGGNGEDGGEPYYITVLGVPVPAGVGGDGGDGGDGGNGGNYTAVNILNSTYICNNRINISEIEGGIGGYLGFNGWPGGSGLGTGDDGILGVDGLDGIAMGFNLDNSNHCLSYNNIIDLEINFDNGQNNRWDNSSIGNYWIYYDGTDNNGDGIGDSPYNILGSAVSQDNYPLMNNWYIAEGLIEDFDNDGLSDYEEILIYFTNPLNFDSDFDTLSDFNEIHLYFTNPLKSDTDNDGLLDGDELIEYHTDPLNDDTDDDGFIDGDEVNIFGTDPLIADSDMDGLPDEEEVNIHGTDPMNPDSDYDGLTDGEEVNNYLTNPLVWDTDNDGLNDGEEVEIYESDPLNPDTDTDGLLDGEDGNPTNRAPEANDDSVIIYENTQVVIDALANDSDFENDPLSILSVELPAYGTAIISNEKIKYTPNLDFIGTDLIVYTISDGMGGFDTASVTIAVDHFHIIIDNTDPTKDWEYTALHYSWCSGSGTPSDPYIIEDLALDGAHMFTCIEIRYSNVYFEIKNCYITNAGDAGIKLDSCRYGKLSGNTIVNNKIGICLYGSDFNIIENNNINYNMEDGLELLQTSTANTICDNKINYNQQFGIEMRYSYRTEVYRNEISNNLGDCGIFIEDCNSLYIKQNIIDNNLAGIENYYSFFDVIIEENYITNNEREGIYLSLCESIEILGNIISSNVGSAIYSYECVQLKISGNTIENNEDGIISTELSNAEIYANIIKNVDSIGIELYRDCISNEIYENLIEGSKIVGIILDSGSVNNEVYNNTLISNSIQALDDGNNNKWDNGFIGNYWDDYGGVDYNDDKIGDTPYFISGNALNMDNFPIWDDGYTPVAIDDSITTNEDESILIDVLSNDYDLDGDSLIIVALMDPFGGIVINNGDGTITFLPDADFNGITSFTYKVFDGIAESNIAIVSVTINAINDAPIADDGTISTDEDVPADIILSASDIENDLLTYLIIDEPLHGTLLISGPDIIYTPNLNYNGLDSFTFNVNDGLLESNIAKITIIINAINDAPVADAGGPYLGDESISLTLDASKSFDIDGDQLQYRWDFNNDAIWDTDWSTNPFISHTWDDDYSGEINVEITDGEFLVAATAYTTVNNIAPSVNAGSDQTTDEGKIINFFGTFIDPGVQDTHTFEWDFGDGNEVTGTLNPTHIYFDNGVYAVVLTISDDDGGIDSDMLLITVNNVAPTIYPVDDRIIDEDELYIYSWSFSDLGIYDTHSAMINWGDGSPLVPGLVIEDLGEGVITTNHIYETPNPSYIITIILEDNDGGIITSTLSVEVLDKTSPDTSIIIDGVMGDNAWYVSDVNVTLTASDEYSDIYSIRYSFGSVNVEVNNVGMLSFTISNEGTILLSYYSIDTEGNVEDMNYITLYIDKTAPTTTLTIGEPNYGLNPTYITTDTELYLEAIDNSYGSGVKEIKYQVDTNGWLVYDTSITISDFGTHIVQYYSIDKAGNKEVIESVLIDVMSSKIIYTGENCGNYSDPVYLEARLIDMATQLPIQGKSIKFEVGTQYILAETDIDGFASATLILTQRGGDYTVTASFKGDKDYQATTISQSFTIEKETVYLHYTGYTVVPSTVDTIELRATIYEDDDNNWGNLNYIYVTFTIFPTPMDLIPLKVLGPYMVEFTDIDGVGVVIVEIPNLPEDGYLIKVSLIPDINYYHQGEDSDLAIITVYEPTGDFVTGGGCIIDSNGNKGNFGFNVMYKKNGLPKGQAIYIYREGDWQYIIKTNAWIGMAIIDNHSIFEAKCVVQKYNSKTGVLIWSEGNYLMQVDVWDGKEDGNTDVFQITVYDKYGIVYHEAGFNPYGYLIGGNIVIHTDKKE